MDKEDWPQIELGFPGCCGQLDWYYYPTTNGDTIFVLVIVDGLGRLRYLIFYNFKVFRMN